MAFVHLAGVEQSGKAYEQCLDLKRVVAMVCHLHEGQLRCPLLERLAVDTEAEAACYGGEESLLPRPARRLDALLYGGTLVGKTLGSEGAHP